MRNLIFTLLVFSLAVIALFITKSFQQTYLAVLCKDVSTCRINPDFKVTFDNNLCIIQFYAVWMDDLSCFDSFVFSNDNGVNWTSAEIGKSISQRGVSDCDILISQDISYTKVFPLKNKLICNCGPCMPSGKKQKEHLRTVLRNPTDKFISFDISCCEEYQFVFHDNSGGEERITSILSSLRIKVDYLNRIEYSLGEIDDTLKLIHLLRS